MVASVGARRLMVDTLSAAVHQALARDVDAIVLTDLVERLRAVKGPAELALVRAAARYADAVLDAIRAKTADIVRGGGTELDILSAGLSAAAAMQKAELGPAFGHTKVGLTVFDVSQMSAFGVLGLSHEVRIRSIVVKEELSKWIIAGAGGGSVVVVGGLVVVVRKKHAQLESIMAMLFTEVEWATRLPLT
jgi:hypothetical protein